MECSLSFKQMRLRGTYSRHALVPLRFSVPHETSKCALKPVLVDMLRSSHRCQLVINTNGRLLEKVSDRKVSRIVWVCQLFGRLLALQLFISKLTFSSFLRVFRIIRQSLILIFFINFWDQHVLPRVFVFAVIDPFV